MDTRTNVAVGLASGDALDVRRFSVEERMSTLFRVSLVAVSTDPDLDFEAAVGRPARFEIRSGAGVARTRIWTGVCSQLQQTAVEEGGLSTYAVEIVPALWLATQRRNYRMFQHMSEVDVALQILAEWDVTPEKRLTATYKKRKYRVQYGESDFTFISRTLEDAGVSFYFTADEGESRLVLSDAPETAEPRAPRIVFRDNPSVADREHVTAVSVARRVRPGSYTVLDHDHRRPPGYRLTGAATTNGPEDRLERYDYSPGAFLFEADGGEATPHADDKGRYRTDEREAAVMARRRLSAERAEAADSTFETNALDLAPGVVLGLLGHPRRELGDDRQLLVVAARLSGEIGSEWLHACEARGTSAPYHPPLTTPKPRVTGVESATVVGPPGEEIHTDEFGRVRVHFHWDRESRMDDNSSCWIHVSQPWGGAGYGAVNLPRVGQEVIVDFLGGDPDRPVITGRVFTNLQKVPYRLPESRTQSGWKSSSTGGEGGYNEILFEDARGSELVNIQAQKDLHALVKNDEEVRVLRDRAAHVVRDETVSIGDRQTITVGRDRAASVGMVDSTLAGVRHVVSIAQPGAPPPVIPATSATMIDQRITHTTGLATITLNGPDITLEAAGSISIKAAGPVTINGKTIEITAEGLVDLNGSVIDLN